MSTAVPNAPQHSTSMSRRFQFDFSSYCMTHTFMSSLSHVSWHVTSCMHIHARGSMQSHSWNFSGCIHGCPRAQFANCTAPSIWGPRACVSSVSLCTLSGGDRCVCFLIIQVGLSLLIISFCAGIESSSVRTMSFLPRCTCAAEAVASLETHGAAILARDSELCLNENTIADLHKWCVDRDSYMESDWSAWRHGDRHMNSNESQDWKRFSMNAWENWESPAWNNVV